MGEAVPLALILRVKRRFPTPQANTAPILATKYSMASVACSHSPRLGGFGPRACGADGGCPARLSSHAP